ncbi:uncharacterized protein [Garra rufa]|uniref:uncharacterized protein n=1 Tax=Garra rufa TaxID=137080 RepID=UPI003CCE629F
MKPSRRGDANQLINENVKYVCGFVKSKTSPNAQTLMHFDWRASSVTKTDTPKEEPLEIIKPVPISQKPATATSSPANLAPGNSAYNKTARPFGGTVNTVRSVSPSPAAPKASIPSASSAFTPAAPSQQPPQPPFPLGANRTQSSPSSAPKPASGRSPFANSSSTSSSGSSSPARVTVPAPPPPPAPVPAAPHPSVYNTPINLYSNENACEVAMGQRRGLLEGKTTGEQHNGFCMRFAGEPKRSRRLNLSLCLSTGGAHDKTLVLLKLFFIVSEGFDGVSMCCCQSARMFKFQAEQFVYVSVSMRDTGFTCLLGSVKPHEREQARSQTEDDGPITALRAFFDLLLTCMSKL